MRQGAAVDRRGIENGFLPLTGCSPPVITLDRQHPYGEENLNESLGVKHKRDRLRSVGIALGLTTIGLLWIVAPAVSPSHQAIYHWSGSPLTLFLPILLDFLIVWLLIASALIVGHRSRALWLGILLFLPFIVLKSWALYEARVPPQLLSRSLFCGGLSLSLFLTWFRRAGLEKTIANAIGLISTILMFVGVSGLALLCQLVWFSYQSRNMVAQNAPHPLRRASVHRENHRRLVWILFDELSYAQIFEHRQPGLQLPNFDAFAKQSTVLTDVLPAEYLTEKVVPALFTGYPIDQIQALPAGGISLHNPVTNIWHTFDEHDTVFQDARNDGYETALAGWYNPYCRLLPTLLDTCFWVNGSPVSNGMEPAFGVWGNMLAPVTFLAAQGASQYALHHFFTVRPATFRESEIHIADLQAISHAADQALLDHSATFVMLHYPIPHPPGIYSRATQQLTNQNSSYLDNLALADQVLAHIRSILEHDGQWDDSTIVIMGDHSWRTPLWRPDLGWTAEEENASGSGIFDPRPAYMIKCAGQQEGALISKPFDALKTRKLMDALLARTIRSRGELAEWIERQMSLR